MFHLYNNTMQWEDHLVRDTCLAIYSKAMAGHRCIEVLLCCALQPQHSVLTYLLDDLAIFNI